MNKLRKLGLVMIATGTALITWVVYIPGVQTGLSLISGMLFGSGLGAIIGAELE